MNQFFGRFKSRWRHSRTSSGVSLDVPERRSNWTSPTPSPNPPRHGRDQGPAFPQPQPQPQRDGDAVSPPNYHTGSPPDDESGALMALSTQSLALVVAELAPIPCIGALVGCLTIVFQAVEKTRVNNTIVEIGRRADHWNQMHELLAFVQFQGISEEIRSYFSALDSCLNLFSYATDVAQMQWVNEFNTVQGRELAQLEHMRTLMGGMDIKLNTAGQTQNEIVTITNETLELLHNVMAEKMVILQNRATTPVAIYADAQQTVQTIRTVTHMQLPTELLLGRQCILDANVPIKTGVTCDVYTASFLTSEKVAKKVFRIGLSDKEHVERYAHRFLRDAKFWATFRSDYTLPFYGIGMEAFEGERHFQLYMVSPLMRNFDAVTYLRQHKESPGMKGEIMRIITDAAKGLQYLHNRNPPFVHSGMRGDNILITDSGGGILGGFGLTRALQDRTSTDRIPHVIAGKTDPQRWAAPETFEEDTPVLRTASDVWGWAMVALELISGRPPYYQTRHPHTIMLDIRLNKRPIRAKHADFEQYALKPDEMWAMLERCWEFEPEKRPTIDEVLVELEKMAGSFGARLHVVD